MPLLAGDYCEADYDGCQDNPCTEGTNCTDLTAAEEVSTGRQYNCSECPPGTKKDGDACYRKYSRCNLCMLFQYLLMSLRSLL